jgi:hypothetical protein
VPGKGGAGAMASFFGFDTAAPAGAIDIEAEKGLRF